MPLLNDLVCFKVDDYDTAHRIFFIVLIPIGKVNACDQLQAVNIEFVGQFYPATQLVLLYYIKKRRSYTAPFCISF